MLVQMIQQPTPAVAAILTGGLEPQFRTQKCCHAGIQINLDGNVYESNNAGTGWQFLFAWLLNGTNAQVQITRTIDSGTLSTDAGAGPLVLSTTREYKIQECVFGNVETATITLELQRVSDSVALSSRQYTMSATLP